MIAPALPLPIAAAALALAGCSAVVPINPPIERVDLASGDRMARLIKREQRRNHPEAMVLLAFSGGGTRAAALSYGVLEALRRTPISVGGQPEPDRSFLDEVDLLCSDLGPVQLARAAAPSSAVPVVLSPVTWGNHGGRCGTKMPTWVQDVVRADSPSRPAGRVLLRFREIQALEDSARRPWIHVVDGGVSDNLGLRGALEAFEELEASENFRTERGFSALRHIVVIVVNSRSDPSTDWDRSRTPPGFIWQLLQSSSLPIDHFSSDSVELLKDIAQRWANQRRLEVAEKRIAGMTKAQAEAAAPALSFDAITDPVERRYFMDLPTSFTLPPDAVDRLRAVGGRRPRESRSFQALLRQIEANRAALTGTAPSPKAP